MRVRVNGRGGNEYPEETLALRNVTRGNGMVPELGTVLDRDRVALVPADSVDVLHD